MWNELGLTDSYSRCRPRRVICRGRRLKAGVPLISIHCETRISGFNLGSSARRLLLLLQAQTAGCQTTSQASGT